MKPIQGILETSLHTTDLPAAEAFYTRLLGREPLIVDAGRYVFYKLEGAMFLLFDPTVTAVDNHGIPPHGTTGTGHVCFRIEEGERDIWRRRLAELDIPLEAEHVWPNGAVSLYFRDPAGNSLELAPWRIWGG